MPLNTSCVLSKKGYDLLLCNSVCLEAICPVVLLAEHCCGLSQSWDDQADGVPRQCGHRGDRLASGPGRATAGGPSSRTEDQASTGGKNRLSCRAAQRLMSEGPRLDERTCLRIEPLAIRTEGCPGG